jgi:4-diphosphocytidyl-2-C-methyl-D-erythritol kinase
MSVTELAPAKVNLVLRVGEPGGDGLHPLCSLFATIALADEVTVERAEADAVVCPGVDGHNLAAEAVSGLRAAAGAEVVPPLRVTIDKRIPVAAGLGGGSADAAAVLRAADRIARAPVGPDRLRAVAARVGADVPSQVTPRHALVTGIGEGVEPVGLMALELVLVPSGRGLSTAEVYGEFDRLGGGRTVLGPAEVWVAAGARSPAELAPALENDLEPAALRLRPELEEARAALLDAGALAAKVTGSGPTVFGLFADAAAADSAAGAIPDAIRTRTAGGAGA